jgi:hypothetical protein
MTISNPGPTNFAIAEIRKLVSVQYSTIGSFSSGPLYDCICQFVFERNNDYILSATDRQFLLRSYQPFTRDDFIRANHPVLKTFVRYTIPGGELEDIATSTKDKDELLLLQTLLIAGQCNPKWHSFGSDLLRAAVIHENLALLDRVIESGVDIDKKLVFPDSSGLRKHDLGPVLAHRLTSLQFSVRNRREDLIEILNKRGATILPMNPDYNGVSEVFLRDAVSDGLIDLVQPLLAKLAASRGCIARRGTRFLDQAVRHADRTMIDSLLQAGLRPYDSCIDRTVNYSRIVSFECVHWTINTPFMAALDMYLEECNRLSAEPILNLRKVIIKKLIGFPTDNLDKEQQLSRHNQVVLGSFLLVLAGKYELREVLQEKSGLDPDDTAKTIRERWRRSKLDF